MTDSTAMPSRSDTSGPSDGSRNDLAARQAAAEELTSPHLPATLVEYLHACPVCSATDLDHYVRVASLFEDERYIVYERCGGCGVVLRNPRQPASLRLSLYEEKILPDDQKQLLPRNQRHYRHMLRWLVRLYGRRRARGVRMLDFGCGAGGFLVAARDAGLQVEGLEVNKDLARHVEEQYGIPVFRGLIDDPRLDGERYQIVVSSQVFEHLLDPRQTLEQLAEKVEPGGLLLIEVPNQRAFRERRRRGSTMDDSHYFYFDAASLSGLLEGAGFDVLRVSEGVRLYRRMPFFGALPPGLLESFGAVLARAGLRTGLAVIARKR